MVWQYATNDNVNHQKDKNKIFKVNEFITYRWIFYFLFDFDCKQRLPNTYLVYKLYRRRTPFERLGGAQATVSDCVDATAILMSSGGPGARKANDGF